MARVTHDGQLLVGYDPGNGALVWPDGGVLSCGDQAALLGREAVALVDRWVVAR